MKKLSITIAKHTGMKQSEVFAFLRTAQQSHSARMGNAGTARKPEVQAHYRTWLARVRAEARLDYYGQVDYHEYLEKRVQTPAFYTVQHVQSVRTRSFGPVTGGWKEVEARMNALGLYPLDWVLTSIEEV
jgi:hypothetical protein